jgi:hypothetical protein
MKIAIYENVTAFAEKTIGSKVANPSEFMGRVESAVADFAFPENGQGFIPLSTCEGVTCGVGLRTENPEDYIARPHRGVVGLYLKREMALPATFCAVVVYTASAYNADPEVAEKVGEDVTHVLVAVIATGGDPKPPVDPWRFVSNLGGGNLSYGPDMSKADAVALASEVVAYHGKYCVVAD